jgi:hypothetical protein
MRPWAGRPLKVQLALWTCYASAVNVFNAIKEDTPMEQRH